MDEATRKLLQKYGQHIDGKCHLANHGIPMPSEQNEPEKFNAWMAAQDDPIVCTCGFDAALAEQEPEHEWVPANDLVRWEHCRHCGIIRRKDHKNSVVCKGPAKIALRPTQAPALKEGDAKGWRMQAYYYSFKRTGVDAVDRILSAVACAGKAYHHTASWQDEAYEHEYLRGTAPVDWIQNAALDAAALLSPSPSPLAWTSERPTREGWYWWRLRPHREADIVRVFYGGDPDKFYAHGLTAVLNPTLIDDFQRPNRGEWLGPLTPEAFLPKSEIATPREKQLLKEQRAFFQHTEIPYAEREARAATFDEAAKMAHEALKYNLDYGGKERLNSMLKAKAAEARGE